MSTRLLILSLLLLAGAAACFGGKDAKSGDSVEVLSVVLARGRTADSLPVDPSSVFGPTTREIWGIVTLRGLQDDLEVTGVWNFLGPNGRAVPQEMARASVSQPPADAGPEVVRRVALVLRKPTDFELGIYQLDVLTGGESQVKLQFTIAPPAATSGGQGIASPTTIAVVTAATPTATAVTRPTPGRPLDGRYTVQSGDTLGFLAGLWGVTVEAIADLNDLADTALIVIGQVLLVPGTAPVVATQPPLPLPTATVTPTQPPTATPSITPTPAGSTTPTPTSTATP